MSTETDTTNESQGRERAEPISGAKLEANRENAKRSTGPKTPEGKAASRLNALKHGLLSAEILLWSESDKDLETLRNELRAELHPATLLEEVLVDRVVTCIWRLKRALRAETATVNRVAAGTSGTDWRGNPLNPALVDLERKQAAVNTGNEKVLRYETTIERQLYRALNELKSLQDARNIGSQPDAPDPSPAEAT